MATQDSLMDKIAPLVSSAGIKGDLSGGFAAFLISLPLSMMIGLVAFAPLGKDYVVFAAISGIYGAVFLSVGSVLFGGRSIMVSGPRAASALILASLIEQILRSDDLFFPSGQTIPNVICIAFFTVVLAGLFQFLFGFFKMGHVVKNIPHPVVSGFINSTAILIVLGQVWILFDIPKQDSLFKIFPMLGDMRPLTMVPAIATIAAMAAASRWIKVLPSTITGILVGSLVYYAMKEGMAGYDLGATLGEVTTPFPVPQFSGMWTSLLAGGDVWVVLLMVIPASIAMAALASLDTLLCLSALDEMMERRSDSNKELIGHGAGNMLAGLLGGLIGSGGLIRTKPGYEAGGRTQRMGIFAALLMVATLFLFYRYFELIPRSVVSGVLLVLAYQLFDRWSFDLVKGLFKHKEDRPVAMVADLVVILLVVGVALLFNLIVAVAVGLAVAVFIFISRMSHSLVRNQFRGPALHARSVWDQVRHAILEKCGHRIAVLELEGAIFFGTADSLEERIDRLIREGVTHVILDAKRLSNVDSTGCIVLKRINRKLRNIGGKLALGYILEERRRKKDRRSLKKRRETPDRRKRESSRPLWLFLKECGVIDAIGEDLIFSDTDSALVFCENDLIQIMGEGEYLSAVQKNRLPPMLNGLSDHEIKLVRRRFTREKYTKGDVIFEQGDIGDALYFLARGRVDVYVDLGEGGYRKRVQTFKRGAIFGEMAILDDKPRAASVVAVDDTVCYRLSIVEFARIKNTNKELALKLFSNFSIMLSERVRSANTMISELEK